MHTSSPSISPDAETQVVVGPSAVASFVAGLLRRARVTGWTKVRPGADQAVEALADLDDKHLSQLSEAGLALRRKALRQRQDRARALLNKGGHDW